METLQPLAVLTGCCFLLAVLASLAGSAIGARLLFMATVVLAMVTASLYLFFRSE
jgi:hypothetical protein